MTDSAGLTSEKIKCPLCQIGDIDVTTRAEYYSYSAARAFGKVKQIPVYHPEQIKVDSNCQNCKAKKSDIKEALERGSGKSLSHEEILKRIKDSGLPLILESKKKDDADKNNR